MTAEIETIKAPQEYLPEKQLTEIKTDLERAQSLAQSLRVVDEESLATAESECNKMKQRQKGIEAFRLAIVKPFKDHIATIDRFFKDLAGKYDEPRETLEDKGSKYRDRKREAERKEREKREEEARKKEEEIKAKKRKEADELAAKGREAEAEKKRKEAEEVKVEPKEAKKEAPASTSYHEGVGRTTYVKDAEHRIEDRDLIPDEFWVVDEKAVAARVRGIRSTLEVGKVYRDLIPGVVITCIERASYAGEK